MNISATQFSINAATLVISVLPTAGSAKNLLIKTMDNIPSALYTRSMPALYPAHDFQTGFSSEVLSMGLDPFRSMYWTANWIYAHCEVGAGRYTQSHNGKIAANVHTIVNAFMAAAQTLGVQDLELAGAVNPTIVPLPQGKFAYGAEIPFLVRDFRNQ